MKTALFNPVEHTQVCREQGIKLKRGTLLTGSYGTGKTLTALHLAKKCVANGWTFFYLQSATGLADAVRLAHLYSPAVLFVEDIDTEVCGERDVRLNQILNVLDGVDTKNTEVMTVFTTNHLEQINPAMLRAGRLDYIVEFEPPNAKAAEKLIRFYAGEFLDQNEDITSVGHVCDGFIPATIAEVCERSKLSAVSRMKPGEKLSITTGDLLTAANYMGKQLERLSETEEEELSDEESAASIQAEAIESMGNAIADALNPGRPKPSRPNNGKPAHARA